MRLHITYCSKDKKTGKGEIPAIERYDSSRIREVKELADRKEKDFAILSGKYGLIPSEKPIPEYDKLLRKEDIERLLPEVKKFLKMKKPEKVIYHTKKVEGKRKPYFELIKESCKVEETDFEKRIISQDT
ncbi:DUF6884 domain-containing protein [Candidatus Nanohalobium constans]|nr:DUF6884 domain-containing protein [Candidatus Nanohalobium constans]